MTFIEKTEIKKHFYIAMKTKKMNFLKGERERKKL